MIRVIRHFFCGVFLRDLLPHNKDVVNFCHRPLPREKTAADHLGPGLYQLSGTTVVLLNSHELP